MSTIIILVNPSGCTTPPQSSTTFRCQMCHPSNTAYSQLDYDRCVECARSKISKGLIYYYYHKVYERNLITGQKELVSSTLVERWIDDADDETA